ncbi:MAG TPA: polyprenol monophosphomannose synthase [Actinomycetota bacterium]|nr:polyprenol monophosphomannose synthase [Actinomycetota bacterium]
MATLDKPEGEQALVIVPTYNERENIAEVARRLFDASGDRVDLLVIDDGSPDGTADLVRDLAEGPHDVHLLERPGKQGLGTAYVLGFNWALERGYSAVVEMDADLSHDPADVPRLLDALADADLVIGSRYVSGGGVRNWSKFREALSRGGNFYARAWLGFDVRDATSGFRAYRTEMLRRLDLTEVRSEGYAFQIELTRRIFRAGGRIAEVPIIFIEREQGESKMSRRIVIEAVTRVTRWGIADRFGRRSASK